MQIPRISRTSSGISTLLNRSMPFLTPPATTTPVIAAKIRKYSSDSCHEVTNCWKNAADAVIFFPPDSTIRSLWNELTGFAASAAT